MSTQRSWVKREELGCAQITLKPDKSVMSITLKWAWEAESGVIPRNTRYGSSTAGKAWPEDFQARPWNEVALWLLLFVFVKFPTFTWVEGVKSKAHLSLYRCNKNIIYVFPHIYNVLFLHKWDQSVHSIIFYVIIYFCDSFTQQMLIVH